MSSEIGVRAVMGLRFGDVGGIKLACGCGGADADADCGATSNKP